jgi:hypothetical protein
VDQVCVSYQGDIAAMEKWYVAHGKLRNEELLWKQFCLRNFESYYSCIKVPTVNPHARRVQPYFSGYMFVHVYLELIGKSNPAWMPGGIGLASFDDEPVFVSDDLVYATKKQINNLNMVSGEPTIPLCNGDNVAIHDGVFEVYVGVFETRLSGTDWVRVLMSLLDNWIISVDLPVSRIHRIY